MKVLHVITGLRKAAGTSVFVVELSGALKAKGVPVRIAICNLGSQNDLFSDLGNTVSSIKSVLKVFPSADLVHIHGLWTPVLHRVHKWAHRNGIPVIWSPHGMLAPWAMSHKRWKKILPWYLYQKGDLKRAVMFHATSAKEADWIRDLGFTQKIVVAPLGTRMPSQLPPCDHMLKTALFVGRIYPVKGLSHLITAWSCLPSEIRRGWQLRLVGPDQAGHMGELKRLADRLGVSQEIHFSGSLFDGQLSSAYRDADLFVLPSYTENFGGVVVDALSYGVPVITTKGTPWEELLGQEGSNLLRAGSKIPSGSGHVQGSSQVGTNSSFILHPSSLADNGRCGWWIDIGVEPLAAALREAINLSDDERHAMGENGRRLVEAKYTWPAIAEQMKAAYAWILNGGDTPPYVRL